MTIADDPALFEKTADERIARLRATLETIAEKAEARADKAVAKAEAARLELEEFDSAIAAVRREATS